MALYIDGSNDASKLDEYEEGSWTPRVQGLAISDGSNPTNSGRYVKIGRLIQIVFYLDVGTKSYETGYSSTSQLVFTGLPFANGHGGDGYAGLDIGNIRYLDGGNSTQSTNRMICFNIGATQSQYTGRWVQLGNNNFVNATLGDLYNNFTIHASGLYQTA